MSLPQWERFKSVWEKEGLPSALKKGVQFITTHPERALTGRYKGYQGNERVDLEQRIELLQKHITEKDRSILDIGCNEGIITRAVGEGRFTVGIDIDELALSEAKTNVGPHDSVSFMYFDVGPDSVCKIPEFDVILLLTVYHHWRRELGDDTAKQLLSDLLSRTDRLFFEVPSDMADEDTSSYLNTIPGVSNVEYIAELPYKGVDRTDDLLVIDTDQC